MDRIRNSKQLRRVEGELRVAPGGPSESSPRSTPDSSNTPLKRTTNEMQITNSPSLKSNESFVVKERDSLKERLDKRLKESKGGTVTPLSVHKSISTLRRSRRKSTETNDTWGNDSLPSLLSSSQSAESDEVLKFQHMMDAIENDKSLTLKEKHKSMAALLDSMENTGSGIDSQLEKELEKEYPDASSVTSDTPKSETLEVAPLEEGTMEKTQSGSYSSPYESYPYSYTAGSTLPPPQEKGAIRFHLPGRIQHKTTIKVAHFPTDEKPVVVNIEQPDEKEEEEECEIPCFANNSNFMCPPAPAYPQMSQYSNPSYNPYGSYGYASCYPSNGYGYGYGYPYS